MNTYNLTFSGEILTGHDPAQVKLRFGRMFAIDDPVRLERFFSGQTIILRRNLERKAAAQLYHELQVLGVVAALVKVTTSDFVNAIVNTPTTPTEKAPDPSLRDNPDSAEPLKDRNAQSLRQAAEKKAADKALLEEQKRRAAEETEQREAAALAARRLAAEESARQTAERARQKAEEDAARRAELEARKLREAQEAARLLAEHEEQKRWQAQEAARLQAEREAIERQEAEEAARLQAELDEIKRQEAEEAAQRQAGLEAIKHQEAEEAARLQAELDEIKRQEAEEVARIKAEAQRKQAQARRESAEARRAAAAKLARQRALRKEEKRKAAALQSERKAQRTLQLRQQAEEAARDKAERRNKEMQERLEQAALSAALQEKAVQRAAAELAQQTAFKPANARIKTRLETPQRRTGQSVEEGMPRQRKRQSGEPNLYTLRAFRNTEEVRTRAEQSRRRMRLSYQIAALALASLLLAGANFMQRAADPMITGARALAVDPQSGPLLLAGNTLLFHDRSGSSTKQLSLNAFGVSQLEPPLAFDGAGALLGMGQLSGDSTGPAGDNALQLLRCEIEVSTCQHFSPELEESAISAFVLHPLEGNLLLTDSSTQQLLKVNRKGQIVARATAPVPPHPLLRLHGGLLLMNSADGPGISVLRYEDNAFGQQLDEILILPPTAQTTAQSAVGDFLWSGNSWWASLQNPESGSIGLYRFDSDWNYLDEVALPPNSGPLQLVSWGEKILINDPGRPALQRYNAQGAVEAPFAPSELAELIAGWQRRASLTSLAWRGGLLVCALTAVLGFCMGYLQYLRYLVYRPQREHGTEPIDDYADTLQWIAPVAGRQALLRSGLFSYCLLATCILTLAILQSLTTWWLTALLLALSGPAIALLLLGRYPPGHIGIVQDKLVLVDHSGMYHFAGGARVQYRGAFLMIDDVVVFCGSRLLPVFSYPEIHSLVSPMARVGVKVDRITLMVKLLQCAHPLVQGALAIVAAATAAAILLCLSGSI